ncbi:MAG: hypothetical protein ACOYD9_02715 [Pyramidobacter sp.]
MLNREVPQLRRALKILGAVGMMGLAVLWLSALKKDSNLTAPPAPSKAGWEFRQVSARRELGKDLWIINSDVVVHGFPVEEMTGISTRIDGPAGLRTINAETGEYDDGKKTLVLENATGQWFREDHVWDWKTRKAHWAVSDDLWTFPEGLTASCDIYFFECRSAVMKEQNEIHVENGRIQWWN